MDVEQDHLSIQDQGIESWPIHPDRVAQRLGLRHAGELGAAGRLLPAALVLAVQGNRFITDWIADTGRFTPNQISAGHTALIRHFCRGFASDADRFDGVTLYRRGWELAVRAR